MSTAICIDAVSKSYRLGLIGGATLKEDFARAWARLRGKSDPFAIVGEESHQRRIGEQFWALQKVSFQVSEGEVLGVVGRNGAGKSTLLKILSQVTAPTSGEVKIKGRIASLLEVGTGFHPELSGRENVFLNGAILGMTKREIRSKFDEIVAFSGIEEFIGTPVKRYSSGMYVRLAFAVAAHLEPEILIVDEVLAVGDAAFQRKCLGKMGEVSRQGRTVLFVSHNMEAVRKLCTRAVLLDDGQLVSAGSTDAVLQKYLAADTTDATEFRIAPPPDEIRPLIATEVRIETADGVPCNGFIVGRPWRIRVGFTVRRRTEHCIAALGLVSDRSVPIWTGWSKPADLEAGRYEAVYKNDSVTLAAGRYSLVVGLSTHHQTVHYTEDAGILSIVELSEESDAVSVSGSCGLIVSPMVISVARVTSRAESPVGTSDDVVQESLELIDTNPAAR